MIKARILIAEDEAIIARDLSETLKRLGHTVLDSVLTGEQAISKAATLRPDLMLMDIRLAGKVDGINAAIQIRAAQDVPIMFLTGNTDEATLERAKAAKPLGYLPKPISERDLRVWVEMGLHKAGLERRVRESEQYLYSVLSAVGDAVIATDAEWRIHQFNPAAEALTGWSTREAMGKPLAEVAMITAEDGAPMLDASIKAVLRGEGTGEWNDENWLRRRDHSRIALSYTCSLMKDEDGAVNGLVFAFRDISARKAMEAEREQIIETLQAALDNIKTLTGLLPICAGCKQIRNDDGYWQCVEQYMEEHTQVRFSHSMCADCVRKFYPEHAEEVLAKLDSPEAE